MRFVSGEGAIPCRVFVCGERPGWEEAREGRAFVGPAGDELWHGLWRICGLHREDCWVTNLVKTFSADPPSRAEVLRDGPTLRAELLQVRPSLIVTVGYHAARWFLPHFEATNGDYFHGLAHAITLGRLHRTPAVVVPVVHSSAVLRAPERYANQFDHDLRAVRACLARPHVHPVAQRIDPYRVGLASAHDAALGLDTEFSRGDVQCVTLSPRDTEAIALEIHQNQAPPFLAAALTAAPALIAHMAKAEYHSCAALGIDLAEAGVRVDDTMLMAYLLGLPQSLKVLAYRELGWLMTEYADLIRPLDHTLVHSTLEGAYEAWNYRRANRQADVARAQARYQRAGRKDRASQAALKAARLRLKTLRLTTQAGEAVPPRALTSLQKILAPAQGTAAHSAAESQSGDKTLRQRWEASAFAGLIPLPPPPTWRDVPEPERLPYAMTDAVAARALKEKLWPQIEAQRLRQVYEVDRAVLPMLVRMERVGMACDAARLQTLSVRFAREFDVACEEASRLAGHTVNPLSGPQVSDVLFHELGIRPTRLVKSQKHHTTADKYLKARRHEHAIIQHILDARRLNKYLGTYCNRLPGLLRDGRYHADWKYTRTATGRLAEEVILLIPKHGAGAKDIRDCFHADDGHVLVSCDLSQIELRCMAHLARDEKLLASYAKDEDIHARVAYELLGAPQRKADQDESLHRLPAKTVNFGIINGMTEYGMLDQLHEAGQLQWTIETVREMLQGWWRIHSGVAHYWEVQKATARRQGYIVDLFGRRRWLAALHSTSERVRREAERHCLFAIQSTADGISKVWNARIWRRLLREAYVQGGHTRYLEPWVRIHDDTTLEAAAPIATDVANAMLALVPDLLCIPTTAEAKVGARWGSLGKAA